MRSAGLEHASRAGESSILLSKSSKMSSSAELFHFWRFLEVSFSDPLETPCEARRRPNHSKSRFEPPGDLWSLKLCPTTMPMQLATCTLQLVTCNWQLAACNLQLATCNSQLATCNLQLAVCNLQLARSQLATYNLQPSTGLCNVRQNCT